MPDVVEEVDRLPGRYRVPVVLCYFEGLTQEEAAIRLRLPASTVRVRLMRARARPARPPGAARARSCCRGALGRDGPRSFGRCPRRSSSTTARFVTSSPAAGAVPVAVTALAEGVIQMMWLARLKPLVAVAAALILATAGVAVQGRQQPAPEEAREQAKTAPPPAARGRRRRAGPGGQPGPCQEAARPDRRSLGHAA